MNEGEVEALLVQARERYTKRLLFNKWQAEDSQRKQFSEFGTLMKEHFERVHDTLRSEMRSSSPRNGGGRSSPLAQKTPRSEPPSLQRFQSAPPQVQPPPSPQPKPEAQPSPLAKAPRPPPSQPQPQQDEVKEDVGDRILRIWPASPERLVQPDTYKSPEEKESALSYAPVAAKQTLSPRHAAVPVVAADAPIRRQIQQLRAGGVRVTYKKGEVNL